MRKSNVVGLLGKVQPGCIVCSGRGYYCIMDYSYSSSRSRADAVGTPVYIPCRECFGDDVSRIRMRVGIARGSLPVLYEI